MSVATSRNPCMNENTAYVRKMTEITRILRLLFSLQKMVVVVSEMWDVNLSVLLSLDRILCEESCVCFIVHSNEGKSL